MTFFLTFFLSLQFSFNLPELPKWTFPPVQQQKTFSGIASWYGRELHGKKMANGRPFNMYAFTAAHRTLPLGTRVKVVNPAENRSVHVLITDRGPYVRGRVLDLSYAAAKHLNLTRKGVGHVCVTVLERGKKKKRLKRSAL